MLKAINNTMVVNKKISKIWKLFVLQVTFFPLELVENVFVETLFLGIVFVSSIISSKVIPESSIMLAIYLAFS